MYFKVDRKVLQKALVWLKKQPKVDTIDFIDGQEIHYKDYHFKMQEYIEQIEFALYKTKMDEFYIDYNFAKAIRPALLTKKATKRD